MKYKRILDDTWDFKTSNTKEFTHCYHNYPAMMIPQIARKLLNEFSPEGKMELVLDPYLGSGTTLVECAIQGISAIGTDINPLARMISEAKSTPFKMNKVEFAKAEILGAFQNYSPDAEVKFDYSKLTNPEFWYQEAILHKLAYIDDAIQKLEKEVRLFFMVVLSEIIREGSYTRNGEFKRYKMSVEQIQKFNFDPFKQFQSKLDRNINGLAEFNSAYKKGDYNVKAFNTVEGLPKSIKDESIDMVLTSPPYGDSRTTVAYGQFSRWASEWFDFENAKNIDAMLMGGKVKGQFQFQTESIKGELDEIESIDEKRFNEVAAFLNDYEMSMKNIAKKVRKGGKVCYVVGNRNVKGVQISLDYFTAEIFEQNGFKHDITYVRNIPNKRMPSKTSPSNVKGVNVGTMVQEFIVILTKS